MTIYGLVYIVSALLNTHAEYFLKYLVVGGMNWTIEGMLFVTAAERGRPCCRATIAPVFAAADALDPAPSQGRRWTSRNALPEGALPRERHDCSGPTLGRGLRQMMRTRACARFDAWLAAAARSRIPGLVSFVRGIRRDDAAVSAALTSELSQGQVEGQVNRLKMLKRQSFGRASFDLLRRRVLYRSP